jgi:hypothetical protein
MSSSDMEFTKPNFPQGAKRERETHTEDPEDDGITIPPLPEEFVTLAHELMTIGKTESLSCPHTLLKAEDLCLHFWTVWWSK